MTEDEQAKPTEKPKHPLDDAIPDDSSKLPNLLKKPDIAVLWCDVYTSAIQGAAIVNDTPPKLLSHRAALLADDFLRQLKVRMPQ